MVSKEKKRVSLTIKTEIYDMAVKAAKIDGKTFSEYVSCQICRNLIDLGILQCYIATDEKTAEK